MIEAVVFDLDGTMINSEDASFVAWQGVGRALDKPFTEAELPLVNGIRINECIDNLISHWQLEMTPMALYGCLKIEWGKAKDQVKTLPGIFALHEAILGRGLRIACATASHRSYTDEMLNQFDLMKNCTVIACGDEVENTKPAPDIFLLAAERLALAPEKCLAVEDSVPGHLAAAAAGMTVVVIPGPFNTADEYEAADYIFPDLPTFQDNLAKIL